METLHSSKHFHRGATKSLRESQLKKKEERNTKRTRKKKCLQQVNHNRD